MLIKTYGYIYSTPQMISEKLKTNGVSAA